MISVTEGVYLGLLACGAGAFGGMFGVGGGLIMVPLMTEWLGIPLALAIPASLLGIIATSVASSLVYVDRKTTDIELATKLLLSSVMGAVVGAILSTALLGSQEGKRIVAGVFAAVILASAIIMIRRRPVAEEEGAPADLSVPFRASAGVFGGGVLSTLLGVGGGIVNVPVINLLVGAPVKVAMATSAYMIGVTASSGAAIYAMAGQIDPRIAAPTLVGLFVGGQIGARLAGRLSGATLRYAFCFVLAYSSFLMAKRALGA